MHFGRITRGRLKKARITCDRPVGVMYHVKLNLKEILRKCWCGPKWQKNKTICNERIQ